MPKFLIISLVPSIRWCRYFSHLVLFIGVEEGITVDAAPLLHVDKHRQFPMQGTEQKENGRSYPHESSSASPFSPFGKNRNMRGELIDRATA